MARRKRKSRQESTTECSDSQVQEGVPAAAGPVSPPSTSARTLPTPGQQKQQQQQQSQPQHDGNDDDHDGEVSMPPTKKGKKKKSKGGKSSKKKSSSSSQIRDSVTIDSDNDNDNNSNDQEEEEDVTPLEGTMMGDIMVLLDRTKGVVYSAEERLEDGTRKQVGTIRADGTIQMITTTTGTGITDTKTNDHPKDSRTSTESKINQLQEEPLFPFETDPDDHCESPIDAYQDIVPFLQAYQEQRRKRSKNKHNDNDNGQVQIYDPYYCNGAVRRNLEALGFPHVYNQKEDCYQVWETPSRYPDYDILLTNPPYSGDHIERLIQHITSSTKSSSATKSSSLFGGKDRPWMLLLPQWVHKKDYFIESMKRLGIQPLYLVPQKRYVYLPPPSFRESKKSDVHKKSSPFVSMWYLWGGVDHEQWVSLSQTHPHIRKHCQVARSKNALRDLRRKASKQSKP